MRKGLILLLIMILILFNVDTRALRAKKIDLRLMEQEKAVVFLRLSGSISLLINDGDNSNATCIVNRKSASCITRVWITRI